MAETQHAASDSPLDRHHFLLRRLHSLSGILPVGVFVIMHLFTNFQLVWNDRGATFQHEVDFIHSTPALLFVEITLWGSIAFHAGLGIIYTMTGKSNVRHYKYADNWRYTMQRVTGMIALLFIFLHVATLRWRWDMFGWHTPFYAEVDGQPTAALLTANALQAGWWVVLLYLVGALSVVFHWANGLWTSAITWGITISPAAQKRWGYACMGLGIALTIFTLGAVAGALNYDITEADNRIIEKAEKGDIGGHGHAGDSAESHNDASDEDTSPADGGEQAAQ